MVLKMFDALPPYLGGKRRLVGSIFRHLPSASRAPVLADAFLGGGAVSLYAKARGYRVLCNDLAERSVIVGRALIENDRVKLTKADMLRLFVGLGGDAGFVEETYCPDVVTRKHARFLDGALSAVDVLAEPKRSLLLLLIIKYLLRLRPMGNFGAKTIIRQLEAGAWDEINPAFLRGAFLGRVAGHPRRSAEAVRLQVNRGVFGAAGPCSASRGDAAEFLATADADVAVLDPPYPGTTAYETALQVVDSVLAGRRLSSEPSTFSGSGWREALDELLDSCRHIPVVALSYGNAVVDLEALQALVRRHRRYVTGEEIAYAHCAGLAGEESRARNREFIVVGRNAA